MLMACSRYPAAPAQLQKPLLAPPEVQFGGKAHDAEVVRAMDLNGATQFTDFQQIPDTFTSSKSKIAETLTSQLPPMLAVIVSTLNLFSGKNSKK
jgi:hypothetical protein